MVEHHLRERLARRSSTELTVEAEGLHDGQVRLDSEHRRSGPLLLREDLSTALVEHRVDTADGVLWALDLDEVDGLLESGVRKQARGVADTTARGDDLTSTTVNGIGVELSQNKELALKQALEVLPRNLPSHRGCSHGHYACSPRKGHPPWSPTGRQQRTNP